MEIELKKTTSRYIKAIYLSKVENHGFVLNHFFKKPSGVRGEFIDTYRLNQRKILIIIGTNM